MMMRWAEYLTHMGEMRSAYRMLTENIKWKRPLRNSRYRLDINIIFDRKQVECKYANWIHLAVYRILQTRHWTSGKFIDQHSCYQFLKRISTNLG
jgi:hypothetical protein